MIKLINILREIKVERPGIRITAKYSPLSSYPGMITYIIQTPEELKGCAVWLYDESPNELYLDVERNVDNKMKLLNKYKINYITSYGDVKIYKNQFKFI